MTNKKYKLGWHGSMKTFYATLAAILTAAIIIFGAMWGNAYYETARKKTEHNAYLNYIFCDTRLASLPPSLLSLDKERKWLDQHSYASYEMSDSELKACKQVAGQHE